MAGSSSSDDEAPLPTAFATRILGLKGSLRFRAHGSTQKPHVILRRVVDPGDSSDDGDVNRVVRFSLFAQKRIDVKPGKEILLCVATEDGGFKDIPLVFESDPTSVVLDVSSTSEPPTQEDDDDDAFHAPVRHTVPPKMRRAWTKKGEDSSICAEPAPVRVSIGVQASPESTSRAVEAIPATHSVSVQAVSATSSVSTQATASLSTASVQTQRDVRSMSIQTTIPVLQDNPPSVAPLIAQEQVLHSFDGEAEMDLSSSGHCSLSPMELSSAGTSAASTPVTSYFVSLPTTQSSLEEVSPSPGQKKDDIPCSPSPPSHLAKDSVGSIPPLRGMDPTWPAGAFSVPPQPVAICLDVSAEHAPLENISAQQGLPTLRPPTQPVIKQEPQDYQLPPLAKPKLKKPSMSAMFVPAKMATGPTHQLEGKTLIKLEETSAVKILGMVPKPSESCSEPGPSKSRPTLKLTTSQNKSNHSAITWAFPSRQGFTVGTPPTVPALVARPSFGPTTNPLNIAPSTSRTISLKPPPVGPRSLQSMSSRKPVVIGSGWSAAKNLTTLAPVESAEPLVAKKKRKRRPRPLKSGSDIVGKSVEPSAPPGLPPPPPSLSPPPPPSNWQPAISISSSLGQKWKPTARLELNSAPGSLCDERELGRPSTSAEPSVSVVLPSLSRDGKQPPNPDPVVPKTEEAATVVFRDLPPHLKRSTAGNTQSRRQPFEVVDLTNSPPAPAKYPEGPSTARNSKLIASAKPLAASSSASAPPSTLPLIHPLPAKPSRSASSRGVKRERPQTPDLGNHWRPSSPTPPRQPSRQKVSFPTIQSSATKVLQGDGEPSLQTIHFSSDGSYFVLSCSDRTLRVWNTREKVELARLTHHSPIVNVFWMENDAGVIVLTEEGLVSKWTKTGENAWKWAKVLSAGSDYRSEQDPICFAYARDRIAVSFPRLGVRVWIWTKGIWQPQRSILRQNVTAIKFMEDGAALLGGTRDGALWYCETPNGTLRAYAFLRTKIISLDVSPSGTHVLVGATGGSAALVTLRQTENKGVVEKLFSCKERDEWEYGAVFATKGQAVLFETVDSCVLVWDSKKGSVVYGLEHDEDDRVQAVATVDSIGGREGCMITGTRRGQVSWWALPVADTGHKKARLL